MWRLFGAALAVALSVSGTARVAEAQRGFGQSEDEGPTRKVPGLDKVDVEEHLGRNMPMDLTFTDHTGERVELGRYFDDDRPVLLTFNYYTCPVLCSMIMESTAKVLNKVPWTAGKEFEVVTISIDPSDTPERARKKRKEMLGRKYEKSDKGWHFLVGDQENIDKATAAAGFKYFYNEQQGQYAHPASILFVTPEGKIARYLYGLQFEPNNVRLALFESAKGNTISTVEKVVLSCYQFDPEKGGYSLMGWRVMQIGAGLTVVVLGTFLGLLWWNERRRRRKKERQEQAAPSSHDQPPPQGQVETS